LNPLLDQSDAFVVQDLMRQRRHFESFQRPHSHERDGAPDVVGRDNRCVVHTFINQHRPFDQILFGERGIVARIKASDRPIRSMAMGTIRIKIRPCAVLKTLCSVIAFRELG